MGQPVFYLLAGPNGAGKSTLYRALVLAGTIPAAAEFVNADQYEATHLQNVADPEQRSEQARQWADARRADAADVSPGTHTAVATCKGDWTQELVQPMPEWARRVLWD